MSEFNLTPEDDSISGSAGTDTVYAFLSKGGINDPYKSTFSNTDHIDGGAGFDTFVVDVARMNQYDPVAGTYVDTFFNAGFADNITHIEKLVLIGGAEFESPPRFAALDMSKMAGLQQIWFQAPSTFHQTDRNSNPSFTLNRVAGQQIVGTDGTYSDPLQYYGTNLKVNYLAGGHESPVPDCRRGLHAAYLERGGPDQTVLLRQWSGDRCRLGLDWQRCGSCACHNPDGQCRVRGAFCLANRLHKGPCLDHRCRLRV